MRMSKNFRYAAIVAAAMVAGALTAPALAAGPGGGGGGTATPPATNNNFTTLWVTPTETVGVDAGNPFVFGAQAKFKDSAPTITLTSAPAGIAIANVSTFPPAKGGPWTTSVTTNVWTPTRDQIGQQTLVFTATAGGQTATTTINVTVFDAPAPVTGLTATVQGDSIVASWQGAQFGVGPITYQVVACVVYPTVSLRPGGLQGETCFGLSPWGVTTATTVTIPSSLAFPSNPGQPTNATLPVTKVIVTPVGADGIAGGQTFIVPSSPSPA
jgi:hypothetical protein